MSFRIPGVLLAVLIGSATLPAHGAPSPMDACRADAMKLCRDTRPGGGRVVACLDAQQDKLSATCQAALPLASQCVQEARKLCDANGQADASALRQCARDRAAEFSPACRDALPTR
jgi:hypothetical protein